MLADFSTRFLFLNEEAFEKSICLSYFLEITLTLLLQCYAM